MSKLSHTKATRLPAKLPRIEPAFLEALQAIATAEHWTLAELVAHIKKEPGKSLAAKARLFALDYYRDNTSPSGFAESAASPLETALQHVRSHKTKARKH